MDIRKLIFFEGENYIAINKPSSVSTLYDRQSSDNLSLMMKSYLPTAQVCHRLDKETSGVLVFAKNEAAYRSLAMQFEGREVSKIYHAITDGCTNYSDYQANYPLQIPGSGRVRVNVAEGKPSLTSLKTIENFKYHSLVECRPESGRKHQIRVHLAYLGNPVAADALYGGKAVLLSDYKKQYRGVEQPLLQRAALHAYALDFIDLDGSRLYLKAPYPKDFSVTLRQLRKYGQ